MKRIAVLVAAGALALPAGMAVARDSTVFIDLTGQTFGAVADIQLVDLTGGADAAMTGVGWDLTIEAFSPSWLSEATIGFGASGGADEVFLTPGVGDDFSGVGTYSSPIINFGDVGIPDLNLPGGILQLSFFDTFDDGFEPQAVVLSGGITIQYIPAPGALALLGLGGLVGLRRRRR